MAIRHRFGRVDHAYRPSGEFTFLGLLLMLAGGGAVAAAAGYLFGLALPWIASIAPPGRSFLTVVEFLVKIVASLVAGGAVALAVLGAAMAGKNRNARIAGFCALACGLMSAVVAWNVSGGAGVAWFSGLLMLCAVVGLPLGAALMGAEKPFCEAHNTFMKDRLRRTIAPHTAETAMELMKARSFASLASLPAVTGLSNYAEITLCCCPECDDGYLSIWMTLSETTKKSDGTSNTESDTRLVYSEQLEPEQVRTLLAGGNVAT